MIIGHFIANGWWIGDTYVLCKKADRFLVGYRDVDILHACARGSIKDRHYRRVRKLPPGVAAHKKFQRNVVEVNSSLGSGIGIIHFSTGNMIGPCTKCRCSEKQYYYSSFHYGSVVLALIMNIGLFREKGFVSILNPIGICSLPVACILHTLTPVFLTGIVEIVF